MTIGQQLNVKHFPFEIKDKNGNLIYKEFESRYWIKYQHDSYGKNTYAEHSNGRWEKLEYDTNNKLISQKRSDGYWSKREYDAHGNEIYFEDSNGYITDNRPKQVELSMDEIAQKFGIDVNQLKIKK